MQVMWHSCVWLSSVADVTVVLCYQINPSLSVYFLNLKAGPTGPTSGAAHALSTWAADRLS